MKKVVLNNGVMMPYIIMGTSVDDRKGNRYKLINEMIEGVEFAAQNGIVGFDTSRDYGNEKILGRTIKKIIKQGVSRDKLFITTKIGNNQQRGKKMEYEVDISLRNLQLDCIDLLLLHWPLPEYYIENWQQICDVYKKGKVKAIGIANCRERHLLELENCKIGIMPHVIQVEHHPFRTIPEMLSLCGKKNIQVEAYSANCCMLPFVRNNELLKLIAKKYNKSITQVIMKWHVQRNIIPVFSTMNREHMLSNIDIEDFNLSDEEILKILSLNQDYKFHPESMNCPGY